MLKCIVFSTFPPSFSVLVIYSLSPILELNPQYEICREPILYVPSYQPATAAFLLGFCDLNNHTISKGENLAVPAFEVKEPLRNATHLQTCRQNREVYLFSLKGTV